FLVTGGASWEASGAADFFSPLLNGMVVRHLRVVAANPDIEALQAALSFFEEAPCSLIMAVGGGTPLDMAKLVNFFSSTRQSPGEYLKGIRSETECGGFLPFLAVPTTAGTGSEATHFAVLYDGLVKHSVGDSRIRPGYVFLNPAFTFSLSPYVAACTGFDALAQAMESLWAVGSTGSSRKDSRESLRIGSRVLRSVVLAPEAESRSAMLRAAYLAGRAIDVAKTTAAHAFSYCLTARYGLPHGHAVATFLPEVLRQNGTASADRVTDPRGEGFLRQAVGEILNVLGCETVDEGVRSLYALREATGLTDSWMEAKGLSFDVVYAHAFAEANVLRLSNNPVRLARSCTEEEGKD
ncbi:phosphonoacetaldehyde reductase, partial [Fretibacterium fastidiosum]